MECWPTVKNKKFVGALLLDVISASPGTQLIVTKCATTARRLGTKQTVKELDYFFFFFLTFFFLFSLKAQILE